MAQKTPAPTPAPPSTVSLEYIGPANQDWFDEEGQRHTLTAGRRYTVSASLGAYMAEHDPQHWSRPAAPKASDAVKE